MAENKKYIYKKSVCAVLFFVLAVLLLTGVYADADTSGAAGGSLLIDGFTSELKWTAAGSARNLALTKDKKGNGFLSFTGNSGVGSEYASVSYVFAEPADLYYFKALTAEILIEPEGGKAGTYFAELILHSADVTESSKSQINSGVASKLSFNLSLYKNRGSVDSIELRFYEVSVSGNAKTFTCKIAKIEAAAAVDRSLSERFLCAEYTAAGGTLALSPDKSSLTLASEQNDAYITGTVTVKPGDNYTNALRILMANDTKSTSIQVYYTYADTDAFSEKQSVTLDIKRSSEPEAYIVPVENANTIRKLKIVFTGNSKGNITINSVCAVCAYVDSTEKIGNISSCAVSDDGKYIVIKGNVKTDKTIEYRDCTLALYELASYEKSDAIIQRTTLPTSTHSMSTKFEFRLPLSDANLSALQSTYAVVLYKNGAVIQPLIMVDNPHYVSDTDNLSPDIATDAPSNAFKGLQTSYVSGAQEAGAGRVIIDVRINELLSAKNSGYLHLVSGKYIYFDTEYVDSLDRVIHSYTSSGIEVLLDLLVADTKQDAPYTFPNRQSGVKYYALNVSDIQGEMYAGAVVDFLSLRYNGNGGMSIGGYILGRRIDQSEEYNYMDKNARLDEYARNYVMALRLVYSVAQSRNANLRVYASMSDAWRNDVIYGGERTGYDTTLLLESMSAMISAEGSFDWYLLCHSENNAFGITEGAPINIASKTDTKKSVSQGFIGADSIETLTNYISGLDTKYGAAPNAVLYFWQPDMTRTGKLLAPLYAYSYYKLYSSAGVDGFAVSFSSFGSASGDGHSFVSIKDTIKYIDTDKSLDVTNDEKAVLGISKWEEPIPLFRSDKLALRKLTETELSSQSPGSVKGSYHYWDFSNAGNALGWVQGEYCSSVSVAATEHNEKALVCKLDGRAEEYDEFMSIYYLYPYAENLSITPWVTFDLRAVCTDGSENKIEIVIIIGSGADRIEAGTVVESGERVSLTLDLSGFSEKKNAKYIKICVRGAGDGLENATLELYKVTGHSQSYDSSSLAKAIADERQKASDNNPTPKRNSIFWIAAVGGAVVISAVCFLALGKKSRNANPH